jgi:elongation factor Ts
VAVTTEMVKELRDRTGAGILECKQVLTQTEGDIKAAIEILRQRGLEDAGKKASREAKEGRIEVYTHAGSKMAAMVELNCETDFVARTEDFIQLSRDLALHVAAIAPTYVLPSEVPQAEIDEAGIPAEKYYEQVALLAQPFVKDGSQTIEDKIKAAIAKLGENIVVRRFVRYEIGG